MKNTATSEIQPEIYGVASPSKPAQSEEDRFKRLVNLQSELLDQIVNKGFGEQPLEAVAENIRSSFEADDVIILTFRENAGEINGSTYFATESVPRAVIEKFVANCDHIPVSGTYEIGQRRNDDNCVCAQGTFWAETISNIEHAYARACIVLLFEKECEPTPKDRLVLKAISPLVGLISDVAGNKDALRSANDRFAKLASTIPGVVYQRVVTPDGDIRYTYISESAQELFGVSATEIMTNPRALFGIFAPEYASSFRQKLIEASKSLSVWDVEASFVTKDGQLKYTHAIAKPEKQADGSVLWTGVILDATRIKNEAEMAAAATEARTRKTIVESLSQGLLLYDSDDILTLRNSHFSTLFPKLDECVVPGASYADILRAELICGLDAAQSPNSLAARIAERMAMRESADGYVIERRLTEDCWILIKENRTEDGTLVLFTDISEIKRREQRIEHMAHHDALTGLPNRVLFQSRVKDAIVRAHRQSTKIAVACIDLDQFKNVNDTLGHPAGDSLLRAIAERIQLHTRETDTAARLGGDEFAIVLTDFEDVNFVHTAADRLLKALAEPIVIDGQETVTGVSMGIALLSDANAKAKPNKLMANAELALSRAKTDARNTYRFFEPEMDEIARARRGIELDLRLAIDRSELGLYFQPLINVVESRISGFEALIRWHHPERGLVSPDDFITIAEETGLIEPIGAWVLRTACEAASRWCEPAKVAVNISPSQFRHSKIAELVSEILEQTGLDPSRLELEITESVLMQNSAETIDTLHRLKNLGVRIAMDDFGTGYSSLANLLSFPFDKIKIDRSFVSTLETNTAAVAIVRAAIGLGRSLDIDVIAEGVETRDQLAYLRIEGCSEVQGYYFSEPRPCCEVDGLLSLSFNDLAMAEKESNGYCSTRSKLTD